MKILALAAAVGLFATADGYAAVDHAATEGAATDRAPSDRSAGAMSAAAPILRGQECLDPRFARGWVYIDDHHILVDAGRYRYRIEFSSSCRDLAYAPVIGFRGDPIGGRVCGSAFDSVLTRDIPCRIERMDLLSREEYKAIEGKRARDRAERRRVRAERKAN